MDQWKKRVKSSYSYWLPAVSHRYKKSQQQFITDQYYSLNATNIPNPIHPEVQYEVKLPGNWIFKYEGYKSAPK
jgi:hypothetical protein